VVLESLSTPQAKTTPFNELLENLPSGMNALYRRAMLSLDPHFRHILIVSLRWLMCSTGQVTLDLIVDELEARWNTSENMDCTINADLEDDDESDYADFASDTDDTDDDDDSNREVIPYEEVYGATRDVAKDLRVAGREFLKFDGPFLEMQHESVRDFIYTEEEAVEQEVERCPDCRKRFQETIAYEAGPKEGRYVICKIIVRRLNNEEFREKFILNTTSRTNL